MLKITRFNFGNEKVFQEQVAAVLSSHGFDLRREVKLSEKDRVDFMLGTIAMELKLKGSQEVHLRQLRRYCKIEQVTSVCLVSPKVRFLPNELAGKPVYGVQIWRL